MFKNNFQHESRGPIRRTDFLNDSKKWGFFALVNIKIFSFDKHDFLNQIKIY